MCCSLKHNYRGLCLWFFSLPSHNIFAVLKIFTELKFWDLVYCWGYLLLPMNYLLTKVVHSYNLQHLDNYVCYIITNTFWKKKSAFCIAGNVIKPFLSVCTSWTSGNWMMGWGLKFSSGVDFGFCSLLLVLQDYTKFRGPVLASHW